MHNTNVIGIRFYGTEGKKAIKQIMNAKPVRNKYTINANLRMKEFEENAKIKDFFSSIIPDIKK